MPASVSAAFARLRRNGSDFAKVPIFGGHLDVLRCCDVINDETRVRSHARTGESLGIKAVALAVPVDR